MANSPNLGLNLQTTGSNNGTWGVVLNANQSIIDSRMGARTEVDCAGSSNITVSSGDAQNFFQDLTGVLTGNIKYILPAQGASYFITNNTTGAHTITVVNNVAGDGVVVPQGEAKLLISNPDNTTVYSVIPDSFGATTFTGQVTSTVTTGTAPLVISSTTKVPNLYVDRAALADTVTTNANLTGDVASVGNSTTLATVNSNIGSFTSANITVNAKGLITAASSGTAPVSILSVRNQTFTSNGTYTPSSGMVYCVVEAAAAGGGGGGATTNSAVTGGGGAGEYGRSTFTAAQIGASKSVTVGASGAGGTPGGQGSTGGSTSLGTLIVLNGGAGGGGNTSGTGSSNASGGAGGSGGTADILIPGQVGSNGYYVSTVGGLCGGGGGTPFGQGGYVIFSGNSASAAQTGYNGGGYGAGGGGGIGVSRSGGNGGQGVIIITEYCTQ